MILIRSTKPLSKIIDVYKRQEYDGLKATHTELAGQLATVKEELQPMKDIRYWRSEEHTSELQSLSRISYAVFCLTSIAVLRVLLMLSLIHI